MNRFVHGLLALVILFAIPLSSYASDNSSSPPSPDKAAPVTDPALIREHYRQILQRPEYQTSDETDMATFIKDTAIQWYRYLVAKFSESKNTQEIQNISLLFLAILLVLTIAGLLYIALLFSRRRNFREKDEEPGTPAQKLFRPPEFYDEEIRRAIAAGDWHEAWLVAWRQFLSRLEHRHLVEADRTRTNREYLAQLQRHTVPSPALALLTQLVDAYDRVIYGRKAVSQADWALFHQQVDEATLLLHLNEKIPRLGGKQTAT